MDTYNWNFPWDDLQAMLTDLVITALTITPFPANTNETLSYISWYVGWLHIIKVQLGKLAKCSKR